MSITNAYWLPPADHLYDIKRLNPKKGDLGFRHDIPWPLPASFGSQYYGEGKADLPIQPQVLNKTFQGEYHARAGAIPASGGIPLVNIYNSEFKFNRRQHDVPFQTAFGIPKI